MWNPGFVGPLRQHLPSVWALELLLLMRGSPQRIWRPEELVGELRASGPLVADTLQRLCASRLVAVEADGVRFAPSSPELAQFCEELAEAYRTKPVAVINLIAAPSQVQTLADAFKFRGDPK